MSAVTLLALGVFGALGAAARFAVSLALAARTPAAFPLGTAVVNTVGAFLAGILAGTDIGGPERTVLVGGALGAFTTFSTWMVEAHRVGRAHSPRATVVYVVSTLVVGLGSAGLGWLLGVQLR